MFVSWSSFARSAGRCGVVAGALLAGGSTLAQELREVVIEAAEGGEQSPSDSGQSDTQESQTVEVIALEGDPAEGAVEVFTQAAAGAFQPSEYWVGVMCEPAGEALRSQLKLGDKKVLVLMEVIPEGPAAKGGLEKYDIVLEVGGKELAENSELIKAVEEAKENDLSFKVLRGGAEKIIVIKPAKRPESAKPGPGMQFNVERFAPGSVMRRWTQRGVPGMPGGRVFRFAQPGAIAGWVHGSELPDGVSISVTKNGKEPAKITIKKGDKTWETTEDKVSELPEEVRDLVGKMHFHAGDGHFDLQVAPFAPGGPFGGGSEEQAVIVEGNEPGEQKVIVRRGVPVPGFPGAAVHADLEKQIAELSEQIAALRKAIEEMKNK